MLDLQPGADGAVQLLVIFINAFIAGLIAGVIVYVILWLIDLITNNGARKDFITDDMKRRVAVVVGAVVALLSLLTQLT